MRDDPPRPLKTASTQVLSENQVTRDVTAMIQPRTIGVLGASAARKTQGNGVIFNLRKAGFSGTIIPIHPAAEIIDGLTVAPSIDALPKDTDLVVVAIPASNVTDALMQLDQVGIGSAMVFTNGFTVEEEGAFRQFASASRITIHGPNCMGVINVSDGVVLYPSLISDRVKKGNVGLIAQSGSAAISLLNSTSVGFSKVLTMGSEFQVTAPDYMRWFAADDATKVIGIILESIKDPDAFASAVETLHDAGKPVIALKVGRSDFGGRAVQAHTGAMLSPSDAYDCFLKKLNVPTVSDYDELIASLECFSVCGGRTSGLCLGIIGISGGETALACDLATEIGLEIASFTEETVTTISSALKGATGQNPFDIGATVQHTMELDKNAIRTILADPNVDMVVAVQDAQGTLSASSFGRYMGYVEAYGQLGQASGKPLVVVSPSAENTHPQISERLLPYHVPLLRGLRSGLVGMRNFGQHGAAMAERKGARQRPAKLGPDQRAASLREELSRHSGPIPGPIPWELAAALLRAYEIPIVRAGLVRTKQEALDAAKGIGFPLVLKIASPDIPHRSDVGGVELGIADVDALRRAVDRMLEKVRAAVPQARIDGFEMQEQLTSWIEAVVGFSAARPFRPLTIVGTGGTLVELRKDRAVRLSPVSEPEAMSMIDETQLGKLLGGYRNLIPRTPLDALAKVVSSISQLAVDFSDRLSECDINPVLVRPGSGEIRVVDALFIAHAAAPSASRGGPVQ
jgi:acetate---CoA ligase (ADP-forming)